MFFYIFMVITCSAMPVVVGCVAMALIKGHNEWYGVGLGVAFLLGIFPGGVPTMIVWAEHAEDLGTISAQQEIIVVYEKQRDDLSKTMAGFNYPSGALMNADSPVRSIVEQLASVEGLLAQARQEKAEAIKSIEQRRYGPLSGVITVMGDYK